MQGDAPGRASLSVLRDKLKSRFFLQVQKLHIQSEKYDQYVFLLCMRNYKNFINL